MGWSADFDEHFRIDLQIFVHTTTSNQTCSQAAPHACTLRPELFSAAAMVDVPIDLMKMKVAQLKEELLARGDAAPGRLKSVLIINAHTASHGAARKRAQES